jgi:hypothetical protein
MRPFALVSPIFLQRPDRGGGHNPEDEDQLRLRDPEPGRDADLRPQPSPEDGWRLHSTLRRHNRYYQRCRPPPSTFTRRRLAATFDHSPPQQVFTGCRTEDPDTVLFKTFGQYRIVGIQNDLCQIRIDFFYFGSDSSRILPWKEAKFSKSDMGRNKKVPVHTVCCQRRIGPITKLYRFY